jgi:hypothetical protein
LSLDSVSTCVSVEKRQVVRRALLIIAFVAEYSLLETVLLLIYLLPEDVLNPFSGLRHSILALVQFLTIGAIAAVVSVIFYGRHQWKRRVVLHFVTVPGFFVLVLLMGLPVVLLERALEGREIDPGASVLFSIVSLLAPVATLAVVSIALFLNTAGEMAALGCRATCCC